MPTYLTRPVFDFPVNWATKPVASFAYDLRAAAIAHAAPRFELLQSATIQGFEFDLILRTEAELTEWDDFTAELRGRLNGFWIPSPFTDLRIESDGGGDTTLTIRHQNLADTLSGHPGVHLQFTKPGQTTLYGEIESAAVVDGRETLTLTEALAASVDSTWHVNRLLYVRLASDDEDAQFWADNRTTRRVKVVELPTEYATLETGQRPVYLYQFRMAIPTGTTYWRFTGLDTSINSTLGGTISSTAFTTFPITHGALKRSTRADSHEVTIETAVDTSSPLAQFVPHTIPRPLWVTIYETTYAAPNTVTKLFDGRVSTVDTTGLNLRAKCSSTLDVIGRRFPRFLIQSRCNNQLFDTQCGLTKSAWAATVTVRAIEGRLLTCTVTDPPVAGEDTSADYNCFALGWLQIGTGTNFQIRSILQSSDMEVVDGHDTIYVRINQLLVTPSDNPTLFINAEATLYPGCDGAFATCADKFRNRRRFGGHWPAPRNLSVKALNPSTSLNKK